MKKILLSLSLIFVLAISLTSCRDTKEKADETNAEVKIEAEGAFEKAGKSVDKAVEETEEAVDAVEDVVKQGDTIQKPE